MGKETPPVETATRHASEPPTTTLSRFTLTVIEGPNIGASFTIDASREPTLHLGNSEAAAIRLTDPMVSRRHARLWLVPGGLRISDEGSTNGTFVGGLRVFDALLTGGERLIVGDTVLRVDVVASGVAVRLPEATRFGRVVGASAAMRRLYPLLERLALTDVPVVIEGETGTGKEIVAEAIHEVGPRVSGPYVVFDCTAISPNLLEAHLFGHERGAFTGAVSARPGVFEQADGGTLLIDEIGDLDIGLQAKLLRAVQRGEVQRIGTSTWRKVDVRLIAATRRDLEKEIQAGRFRDDLYYRLCVARVELPPLRSREGDVALLASHFWSQLGGEGGIPEHFLARLVGYAWPGNVRELHNVVARRVALGELEPAMDQPGATEPGPSNARPSSAESNDPIAELIARGLPFPEARDRVMNLFVERYVARVLEEHGGNVTKAAAASGIARRYFYVLRSRIGGG
jgi:DNA-binding NtrC family response regulator